MRCYICNTIVDGETTCPHCGADITIYRHILTTADTFYNKGLSQANVRDLSGAIESLQMALCYNKYHTAARNLLGLIYYEIGEPVRALTEWAVSKHFEEDNPLADKYLSEIQNTPGLLDDLDKTAQKYNQALLYCRQGSRDLATIQLKKVLNINPKFVAAHQLLALLYIQDGKYAQARKELSAASKIDVRNRLTLRYNKEVKDRLKEQNQGKKKKKDDLITIQDGNDNIIMPRSGFREMMDASSSSIINIIVGMVIGLLVCFFLIIPTVRQNAKQEAAQSLVSTNEELTNSASSVSQLQKQIASLEEELEAYTGKADAITSYEQLLVAKDAYDAGDSTAEKEAIDQVNRDLLSTGGQALYDTIYSAVYTEILTNYMTQATAYFTAGDYENAANVYTQIIEIEEGYSDGTALYNLAESKAQLSLTDEAVTYFKRVAELYPDTEIATSAQTRLSEIAGETTTESTDEVETTDE